MTVTDAQEISFATWRVNRKRTSEIHVEKFTRLIGLSRMKWVRKLQLLLQNAQYTTNVGSRASKIDTINKILCDDVPGTVHARMAKMAIPQLQ